MSTKCRFLKPNKFPHISVLRENSQVKPLCNEAIFLKAILQIKRCAYFNNCGKAIGSSTNKVFIFK